MKKLYQLPAVAFLFLCLFSKTSYALYSLGPFANQTFCVASYPSSFNTVTFTLDENANGDFPVQSGTTLILSAPAGFAFNPGAGTVTFTAGRNISALTYTITAATISITTTVTAINQRDHISFNNIQVQATATAGGDVTRTGGTFIVNGSTGNPTPAQSFGRLDSDNPYISSAVAQSSTAAINKNCTATSNQILEIQVTVTTSTLCTPTISQFVFSTSGDAGFSQNPTTNISSARVYYTGQTPGFSYVNFFGSVANPNGTFTVTGNEVLNQGAGTYYFYLAYEVPATANTGDGLDASLTSFVFNNS